MERGWVDPRSVKRRHAGIYTMAPGKPALMIGSEAAVNCYADRYGGLILRVHAQPGSLIVKESILNLPDFDARRIKVNRENPVNSNTIGLGIVEGVNNRVYIGHRISLARVENLAEESLDIVISTSERIPIVAYPPFANMRIELLRALMSKS